jgi:hypothetical protein
MYHKPYFDWMNLALEADLAPPQRAELNSHLAGCLECQSLWEALNAAHGLLQTAVLAQPRAGFAGRFNARLTQQQRVQPRLWWGVLALGFSSLGAAALTLPIGFGFLFSAVRVAQQPAAGAALMSGFNALALFASAVGAALLTTAQAVALTALAQPVVWVSAMGALLIVVAWALTVRRLIVGVPVR